MSADNGIYILHTKGPEYRVGHHQAIDNIYGNFSDESFQWQGDPGMMYHYFHADKMFSSLEEALDFAESLSYNYEYLEDGICVINDFHDWDFNSLKENYGKEAESNPR
jgi:hypothetical protein